MNPKLTHDQQEALAHNQGFVEGPSYVLMSTEAYRRLMGVDNDRELAASLKAVREGLDDVAGGRTRPCQDVLDDLGNE